MEEGEGGVWAPERDVTRAMEKAKTVGELNSWVSDNLSFLLPVSISAGRGW